MDKYVELYIARRYVALIFALFAVVGFPATRFFDVPVSELLFSEIGIMLFGIVIVSYILKHGKERKKKALQQQAKVLIAFFIGATVIQVFNVVLAIHTKIFEDMIYLTIAFMAVILNMVSGEPVSSFMSRHLPDSARRRAWTYMIILLLLSNVAAVNRDIGKPNVIIPIDEMIIVIISFVLLWLVMSKSLSTKKGLVKRDKWIRIIVVLGIAVFLFDMMNNGTGINSFGDIGGIIIFSFMLLTAFM